MNVIYCCNMPKRTLNTWSCSQEAGMGEEAWGRWCLSQPSEPCPRNYDTRQITKPGLCEDNIFINSLDCYLNMEKCTLTHAINNLGGQRYCLSPLKAYINLPLVQDPQDEVFPVALVIFGAVNPSSNG